MSHSAEKQRKILICRRNTDVHMYSVVHWLLYFLALLLLASPKALRSAGVSFFLASRDTGFLFLIAAR